MPNGRERSGYRVPWMDPFKKEPSSEGRAGYIRDPGAPPPPPIPDWLREFMLPLKTEQDTRGWPTAAKREQQEAVGQYRSPSDYLMPLGAQEELSVSQLAHMAGFLEWRMGGSGGSPEIPKGMREVGKAIGGGGSMQSYWDEYTRLSEALFPSTIRHRGRWATAFQR